MRGSINNLCVVLGFQVTEGIEEGEIGSVKKGVI